MGQLEGIETKFTNKGYKQIKEISETIKEKNRLLTIMKNLWQDKRNTAK